MSSTWRTIHFPLLRERAGFPILLENPFESRAPLYGLAPVKMFPVRLNWRPWVYGGACAAFERPCRNRFPVPDRIAKHPEPTESRSNGSKAVPRRVSRRFTRDFYRSSAWLYWFRFCTLLENYFRAGRTKDFLEGIRFRVDFFIREIIFERRIFLGFDLEFCEILKILFFLKCNRVLEVSNWYRRKGKFRLVFSSGKNFDSKYRTFSSSKPFNLQVILHRNESSSK